LLGDNASRGPLAIILVALEKLLGNFRGRAFIFVKSMGGQRGSEAFMVRSRFALEKEAKVDKDIIGPTNEVTNIEVDLGPRMLMVDSEALGTSDNISIHVAESTTEELEKLKSAYEIRLVKMLGESGKEK